MIIDDLNNGAVTVVVKLHITFHRIMLYYRNIRSFEIIIYDRNNKTIIIYHILCITLTIIV